MADEIFDEAHAAALRDLWARIRDVPVAILTTVGPDGLPRGRPMAVQRVEPEDVLWFHTAKESGKVGDLTEDQRVGLAFVDAARELYVTATGRAQVVDDRERARALWHPGVAAWFPAGPDDPGLALLRVDLVEAEYWQDRAPRTIGFTARLAAAVTGQPAPGTESGKLQL